MRKLILLFVIAFYLNEMEVSAADPILLLSDAPGYMITVENEDLGNSYLFLSRRESGAWINLDSVKLEENKPCVFTGELQAPEILYLRLENSNNGVSFFAENSSIVIVPDFEKPENTRVSGSAVHNEYKAYQESFSELNTERDKVYKQYRLARSAGEEKKIAELTKRFQELSDEEMEMNRSYVEENRGSWVSPYIIRRSMYYSLSLDELKSVVNSLDKKVDNSTYVKDLKNQISILEKVAPGEKFTDFELPTPDGKTLALSDITGKNYILIDFWASWCGPCRRENPNVVAMYNEFKDRGFDIIGVSLDESRETWLKAIDDDQLAWHHVSDLKGWSSAAGRLYGVKSIPHTVLIDPDGIIIEKNLRGDALEARLEELLTP